MTAHGTVPAARFRLQDPWLFLTLVVALLSVAKGLRWPNAWAATQLQVDYSFGFVKRGLAGAIMSAAGLPVSRYAIVAAAAFVVLAFSAVLLVLLIRRSMADEAFRLLLPVFVSSFAVTYLVHCVGYLDIILLCLTLIALLCAGSAWSMPVGFVACLLGVLFHEAFLLSFFPVIIFKITWDAAHASGRDRNWLLAYGAALSALTLATTVITGTSRPVSAEHLEALRLAIETKGDFEPDPYFMRTLRWSTLDNISYMISVFRTPGWWMHQIVAGVSILWVALFFLTRTLERVRDSDAVVAGLLVPAAVVASLSPMLLQMLGWDIYRWYALTTFNAFLVFCIVTQPLSHASKQPTEPVPTLGRTQIATLVALNMATAAGLFDGFRINTFPYVERLLAG